MEGKPMNYKKGLKIVRETTLASGGTFGTASGIGQHGGSVGNDDFYARGNSMNLFGWGDKGKKKKKGKKFPLYRRAFVELMGVHEGVDSEGSDSTLLGCTVISEDVQYLDILKQMLENRGIHYIMDLENMLIFQEDDETIQTVVGQLMDVITEEPFERGNIVALIGEMDVQFKKPKKPRSEYDQEQMRMGIEVEKEHTDSEEVAANIAMNHLDEFPTYYTGLKEMEARLKSAE